MVTDYCSLCEARIRDENLGNVLVGFRLKLPYVICAGNKLFFEGIMSEKQYHYLVVGGEHHNTSYMHDKVSSLKLEVKGNQIPGFSDKNAPAKTLVPKLIEYKVQEWQHKNGKYYFIATNDENATQLHDIDKMLDEAKMCSIE